MIRVVDEEHMDTDADWSRALRLLGVDPERLEQLEAEGERERAAEQLRCAAQERLKATAAPSAGVWQPGTPTCAVRVFTVDRYHGAACGKDLPCPFHTPKRLSPPTERASDDEAAKIDHITAYYRDRNRGGY